jgi:hypothetical protein
MTDAGLHRDHKVVHTSGHQNVPLLEPQRVGAGYVPVALTLTNVSPREDLGWASQYHSHQTSLTWGKCNWRTFAGTRKSERI